MASRRLAFSVLTALASLLAACGTTAERLEQIGKEPSLTPMQMPAQLPVATGVGAPIQPVPMQSLQTYPAPTRTNSLWQAGARSFFRDPRAAKVGDILTVNIDIGDEAKIENTTTRSRTNTENANASNFLGFESQLGHFLPDAVDPDNLVGFGSDTSNAGSGSVDRSEDIKLTVAAVVTQVLPNGNLVIQGSQEVRVNYEKRVLQLSGVVRPEDISSANTIDHTQIAEARISYGGQGQITDVQQPRLGTQLFDILFPF